MKPTATPHLPLPAGAELWSIPVVRQKIPYSAAHIWRLIAAGQFPKPVKIGPNRVAFLSTEIEAWIAEKVAKRNPAGAA